jgi:D-alanyl-D-alanine carboxypeptidase/D-alanyl-D-alanine-endopeptidase (penicillin-binding protein 4)
MKKYNIFLAVLAIFLLYNCTSTRELYVESGNKKLARKINGAITNSGLVTNMGIKVVSLQSGKTLYSLNSDHLFTPASNNKLYTASAALHYLSPQFKFETSVWIDNTYKDSTHIPRLVLVGGGDPDLYLPGLESIAREISRNIRSIDTLIVDNSLFDDVYLGPGWMWDENSEWDYAQIDAMTFNDNCVDITIEPGGIGDEPKISVSPKTNYIKIVNEAITVEDTIDFKEMEIERRWWENSNIIDISGELLKDTDKKVYNRTVEDPSLFTGTVLAELLTEFGTNVKSVIIDKVKSKTMVPIYTYSSKSLIYSLANFLKESDNLSGELYVKMMGHIASGEQGRWDNGMLAVKTFLNDEVKIDTTKINMVDGSGLSRYNMTSPDQLIQLLEYMHTNHFYSDEFLSALSIGGLDGTLDDRMNAIKQERRIRAKTGNMTGVSCLSGYAFAKNGEPLAFSIMLNGFVGSNTPYKQLQDKIAEILVNF